MKEIFLELLGFFFSKKTRIFLIPFLLVLLIFSVLFVLSGNATWAPFVYAIF